VHESTVLYDSPSEAAVCYGSVKESRERHQPHSRPYCEQDILTTTVLLRASRATVIGLSKSCGSSSCLLLLLVQLRLRRSLVRVAKDPLPGRSIFSDMNARIRKRSLMFAPPAKKVSRVKICLYGIIGCRMQHWTAPRLPKVSTGMLNPASNIPQ